MASERQRLVELALESLQNKKRQIDEEIAALTRELHRGGRRTKAPATEVRAASKRRSTFSKEERNRRSARMKTYWENWRKHHKGQK